jgi:hypothetical protein
MNWLSLANLGLKAEGTEGTCFRVRRRCEAREYAMRRARVYPEGEGVPYYMLRELAVLKVGVGGERSILRGVGEGGIGGLPLGR